MHEIGLAESILDAVQRRAAGRTVARVRVRCGVLNRVDAPSMQQGFDLVTSGSVADGAVVDLVTVPVTVSCRACGRDSEVPDVTWICPSCRAPDVRITGGDELLLESLTFREPQPDVAPDDVARDDVGTADGRR
jgi:hydrogenase nickel incorporation protein HypA/HybF